MHHGPLGTTPVRELHPLDNARANQRAAATLARASGQPQPPPPTAAEVVASAVAQQTRGGGYRADSFAAETLPAGTRVFGGAHAESGWYTDAATVGRSNYNQRALWDSLQVAPHPDAGGRRLVQQYEVIRDTTVASGQAQANTAHGAGGGRQFVIDPTALRPVGAPIHLDVTYTHGANPAPAPAPATAPTQTPAAPRSGN